ncbi:hypothetical protein MTR67_033606 [Solanum verrucosum]|uniref:Uncharacterized protein n=1 Tax=Solanum verrucosum TaxID=315347 RepID=A0AAF0U6Q3_SOLVR|nr:hypothetical protein MTR67_033606 [Solanum verrucosum]
MYTYDENQKMLAQNSGKEKASRKAHIGAFPIFSS